MGATGLHSAEDITAFLGDGETRLIAAAYRDEARRGEIFVLADGRAAELRAWTKQHLRCMFDDCPAPDMRVVVRHPRRRDGFRHGKGGSKHAPESVNHRQGKAVVAEWLRATYPTASVVVEQATDTQRSNIADVMLTLETGQRVAFEVQYAALSVTEWRRRHESYVQQGIIDIWLWGHTRVRKSRREYASGPFKLEDVQDELRQAGMRVTFLNPETGQIGIAASFWNGHACLATEREYSLVAEDLAGVRVSSGGLTSHLIGPLAAVSNEMARELANKRARDEQEAEEHRAWIKSALENGARQYQMYLEQQRKDAAERHARRARIEELRERRRALIAAQQKSRPQRQLLCEFVSAPTLDRRARGQHRQCKFCGQPEAPGDAGTRICRLTRPV